MKEGLAQPALFPFGKNCGCIFAWRSHKIGTNVLEKVINMEAIQAVIDGQLQAVPVLTPKHLKAISKIRTGASPGCAPDILLDLIEAGLVEETSNDHTA
ncbi:hypothetical protein PMI05_01384 [Brevibacillus sp. BC25]|nr:hypothetical protein PMI05_01384 [Brevibacillus sp. BC25]